MFAKNGLNAFRRETIVPSLLQCCMQPTNFWKLASNQAASKITMLAYQSIYSHLQPDVCIQSSVYYIETAPKLVWQTLCQL